MSSVYQIYRSTTIGLALHETLEELVHRQILTSRIVEYILNIFDKIINEKLSFEIKKEKKVCSLLFQGHLLSYRSCDYVWTFIFDSILFTSNIDLDFKINLINQNTKLKIIACPTIHSQQLTTTDNNDQQIKSKLFKKFKSI